MILTAFGQNLSCNHKDSLLVRIDNFLSSLYKYHQLHDILLAFPCIRRYLFEEKKAKTCLENIEKRKQQKTFENHKNGNFFILQYLHKILNRSQCDSPQDMHNDNFRGYFRKVPHTIDNFCALHTHPHRRMFDYSHLTWSQHRIHIFQ
jgi:capsule polysaccharide modification protein KpsS